MLRPWLCPWEEETGATWSTATETGGKRPALQGRCFSEAPRGQLYCVPARASLERSFPNLCRSRHMQKTATLEWHTGVSHGAPGGQSQLAGSSGCPQAEWYHFLSTPVGKHPLTECGKTWTSVTHCKFSCSSAPGNSSSMCPSFLDDRSHLQ